MYVYILNDETEQQLLDKQNTTHLGIIEIKLKGAAKEISLAINVSSIAQSRI